MLIISDNNIEKAVDITEMITAIERAYLIQESPKTVVPNRMHVDNGENTLLLMPGFTENFFGTKLVSVFPANFQKGKPVVNGVMILNNSETGEPLALINGNKLTAMRTAAVGATAAKYLAPENAKTLGIIGAGIQGLHQALIMVEQYAFSKLIICDSEIDRADWMKAEISKKEKNIVIETTKNANQLVVDSDIIVTATTSSKPVFEIDKEKIKNKTFIAVGSYKPEMQELPLSLFEIVNRVYVDTTFAQTESGDLSIPLEKGLISESDISPFIELIKNGKTQTENGVSLFKSVGMSLFDLTFAELVYKNALKKELGTEVKI